MSKILRGAAALVLTMGVISAASASPGLDAALSSVPWDRAVAEAAAHDAGHSGAFQLASNSEASCAATDPCCDDCLGCAEGVDCGSACGCGPVWYASVGIVLLERERPTRGTIVAGNPSGVPFARAQQFDFDFELGPDLTLARRLSGGTIVEGRYYGVDSTADLSGTTPGNFIGGGFTGPGGTLIRGHYLTKLDSTEINLRRPVNEYLSVLAGFRWVELADKLTYRMGPTARGEYDFNNRLYGGQLGASFTPLRPSARWILNIEGKGGLYGNDADGGILLFQPGPIGQFSDHDTTTSFVSQIDFTAGYRLNRRVTLRTGYQLLWLDNVALASDAASRSLLNPSLLTDIDYGDLFYHGAMTSIDFVW
ncbi:MAG TPA: hypothetical protein VEQ85_07850 [Lacipirellulaceae bacterium]|nr:hypothetical protein [Lacipirellulaceae bacterium]